MDRDHRLTFRQSNPRQRFRLDLTVMCSNLQLPRLAGLIETLHLVPDLEVGPILKAHAAVGVLACLRDVFLDILE